MKRVSYLFRPIPSRPNQACTFCGEVIGASHILVDTDITRATTPAPADLRPHPPMFPPPPSDTVHIRAVQYICADCLRAINQAAWDTRQEHGPFVVERVER